MNKKGFTVVELIATLVVLGVVVGITVASIGGIFGNAKKKSEEAFVETIKDAMDMYLNSNKKFLTFDDYKNADNKQLCLDKTTGEVKLEINLEDVNIKQVLDITKSIAYDEFVNPANKDKENYQCNIHAKVDIYRDKDYVYYYSINKTDLDCLNDNEGIITNLPINDDEGIITNLPNNIKECS